jgi:energy-coupling factor transport system permease protein
MIRDITIGQYYPAHSLLHQLDPRMKIIGVFVYLISLFFWGSLPGFVVAGVFFLVMLALSKVPFRFVVRGLKPILYILLFTALLNLLWTPGHTLWRYGIINITTQGIHKCIYMAVRLILLILGSSLLTLTTTPNQLTDAIEDLLSPLKRFGAPVHEVAMMMSIALRFIPILLEETDKIMKAQISRGADFEDGNMLQRLRSMVPLLVPLFVSATRRANELAYAMDARCYNGGDGRTKMKPLKYHRRDFYAYGVLAGYVVILIVVSHVAVRIFSF